VGVVDVEPQPAPATSRRRRTTRRFARLGSSENAVPRAPADAATVAAARRHDFGAAESISGGLNPHSAPARTLATKRIDERQQVERDEDRDRNDEPVAPVDARGLARA
jgi:hypothetical protein